MLLSEYFYDTERLEPEIQDKLQAVLKDWQGVFLDGKGTTTLSVKRKKYWNSVPKKHFQVCFEVYIGALITQVFQQVASRCAVTVETHHVV